MSYSGRPRVPQLNGPQQSFFWLPRMGNPFGFEQNSYQQGMGPGPRFPRPDTEEPRNERTVSTDPYRRWANSTDPLVQLYLTQTVIERKKTKH